MRLTWILNILCACLLVALAGCAPHWQVQPQVSPEVTLGGDDFVQELERVRALSREVNSYRGLARALIVSGDESSELRYAVVFVRPEKLRLEALPLTAAYTLSLLVMSGGSYTLVEPGEKRAFKSSDGLSLLRRLLKLPLREEELMSLMVGRIPEKFLESAAQPVLSKRERSALIVSSNGGAVRFECDPISRLVTRAEYSEVFRGESALVVGYDSYDAVDGHQIPTGIDIALPRDGVRIRLKLQSVRVNGQIRDGLFEVRLPSDYEIRVE